MDLKRVYITCDYEGEKLQKQGEIVDHAYENLER